MTPLSSPLILPDSVTFGAKLRCQRGFFLHRVFAGQRVESLVFFRHQLTAILFDVTRGLITREVLIKALLRSPICHTDVDTWFSRVMIWIPFAEPSMI